MVVDIAYYFTLCVSGREGKICRVAMTTPFHGASWGCSIDDATFSCCSEVKLTCLQAAEEDTLQ